MFDPALFESIFLRAPIAAYVLTPTPDAVVLAVNDIFLQNTGRTREYMVGRSLFEVFPADPGDPTDDGESMLRSAIVRVIETHAPQRLPAQRYPIEKRHPDGHTYFEERFWDAVNTPILDREDRLVCILHTTSDITRQVQAETALRRSEQEAREAARQAEAERRRLAAVVDAVPVGMILSDAQGRILLTNSAHRELWGEQHPYPDSVADYHEWSGRWADGSEHQGQPVDPADWPAARALLGETAPRAIVEIEPFDRSRPRRIILSSSAAVRDAEHRIFGVVVAQLDITDRVRAEEGLRQADRRKDEFLAMLAHELRNPLAPIGAAADLLALGPSDPARVQQTSSIIARQVKHMTGLIDDLLDVSRVTRGLIRLELERLDLKRVVTEAIEQTRPVIDARGHRLLVRTPPGPAIVRGDRKRLVQVVANLLTNAAKYTPTGGDIAVEVELDPGQVKVDVSDTGIGMTPDLVEDAFKLFSQAERTADRAQGGLGIGLALVERLVKLHDGSISAASDGPGRGSRFTLCMPRVDAGTDTAREHAPPHFPAAGENALRVLVVDDNRDAAEMLVMLIQTLGHAALVEHTPLSALERARVEKPDVCLLDLGLPDIDGTELARRLRAQPETASATLIAITGYGRDHDRAAAMAAGFDHYFVKPVDGSRLAELLAYAKAPSIAPIR